MSEYLAAARPSRITEAEARELQRLLAPVSEGYLRRLLRESGVPLDPLVEGIRQDSLDQLERTLLAAAAELAGARSAGDRKREALCRRLVITAKEHARLAARRLEGSPEALAQRNEMISWMIVWLENPEVFPAWLELRRRKLASPPG